MNADADIIHRHHKPERGEMGTFMNYQIRFRLIDLIGKKVRDQEAMELAKHEATVQIDDGNRHLKTGLPVVNTRGIIRENEAFWKEVRKGLTDKQWKWVHYFVIANLTIKEIMEIEDVSANAVKSWAREVMRNEE